MCRPRSAQGFDTRLPLSWFDDTDHETRAAHEWVASFRKANRRADGLALVTRPGGSGEGTWRYMKVHKYAADAGQYLISAMDESGSMSGKPFLEHRVNLYFSDERARTFAQRLASAHARRDAAEEELLRRFYVANMPVGELRQISTQQLNRILELAYSTEQLRQGALDPTSLVEETRLEYARALNGLLFEKELRQPTFRSQVRLVELDPPRKPPVPHIGVVPAWLPSAYEFKRCQASFDAISACALPEALGAMMQAQYECLQLQKLSLFSVDVSASIRLEDFEQLQMQHMMRFVQFVRDSWAASVKKGVLSAIVHASPRWREHAPRPQVYETAQALQIGRLSDDERDDPDHGSRPHRLTRLLNLMAADALRIVTNVSLVAYADFVCARAEVRSYAEDPETLSDPPPLFILDLVSHDDELFLSTSADFFAAVPARLVDEAVAALGGLQPLDPFDLAFGAASNALGALPTVGVDEPQVGACKERLSAALRASTVPLADFVADFAKHMPHIALDVHAHVRDFAAVDKPVEERPSLRQMEAKLHEHTATRARLEAEVPQVVQIGTYLVSVAQVKQQMLDKQAQLIELTLHLIDDRAREAAQRLAREFSAMHGTLQEQPKDIEQLTRLRAYMAECAAQVDAMQGAIDEMMTHYDVLEARARARPRCCAPRHAAPRRPHRAPPRPSRLRLAPALVATRRPSRARRPRRVRSSSTTRRART